MMPCHDFTAAPRLYTTPTTTVKHVALVSQSKGDFRSFTFSRWPEREKMNFLNTLLPLANANRPDVT